MHRIHHASWAMLVFLGVSGVFMWNAGYLHFGTARAEGEVDAHAEHGHEAHVAVAAAAGDHAACAGESGAQADCEHSAAAAPVDVHEACAHEAAGDECQDDHADEAEHEAHAGEGDACCPPLEVDGDVQAMFAQECEHAVAIVDCDECRYEVGVVKLSAASRDLIDSVPVEVRRQAQSLDLTGQIQLDPTRTVAVSAVAGGRVEQVQKFLGQTVRQGDVLAVIASSGLGEAKARYLEVKARMELAQAVHQREKELFEKQVSSQGEYLEAQREQQAAEAALAAAARALEVLGLDEEQIASLSQTQHNGEFGKLVVRAPRDGTIIEHAVSAGRLVEAGEALFTIADTTNLWVWGDLYEKDLPALLERMEALERESLAANVRVGAYGERGFEGTVDLIGSAVDPQTRTVKVRVQVANPRGLLRPGMFAKVTVPVGDARPVVVAPRMAVLQDEGRRFVFRRVGEDLWMRRDVTTGAAADGGIEIVEGLEPGEMVVSRGAFMLKSDILREKMGAGCAH